MSGTMSGPMRGGQARLVPVPTKDLEKAVGARAQAPLPGYDPRAFNVPLFLDSAKVPRKLAHFPAKGVLFAQGDPANEIYYIEKGNIQLSVISNGGKKAILTVLPPGCYCGVWCLAGQTHRMSTATALSSTTVRVVAKQQMLQLLRTDRAFANHFISFLLARNVHIAQQVVNLLFDSTEKRLIRALLFLSQFGAASENDEVTLTPVSQEMLGEMIGSTRTHVNGLIRKLKRLGFVEYNGHLKIHRTPLMALL